ncbi:Hypothetical protein FKW44_024839 [Caligus rogercresseyi]|uniref:Uncharacterized protein n=1 Tax=Caligus rogercresseyi TaxID=217165 RepID=A0A7T8GMM5_CALRO|nr:Hypothetical protein FKW44_024839 [Caligus rogercresseyi]
MSTVREDPKILRARNGGIYGGPDARDLWIENSSSIGALKLKALDRMRVLRLARSARVERLCFILARAAGFWAEESMRWWEPPFPPGLISFFIMTTD